MIPDPPRAVLFDLDGTLADSAPDIAASLNAALAADGLAGLDLSTVVGMVGGGADLLVARALGHLGTDADAASVRRITGRFLAFYDANPCRQTRLYDGAEALLERLCGKGVRLGIVTNKPHRLTHAVLDGLGIARYFGSVVGAQPALALKPAPDMVRMTLAALGEGPARAVMVGDSAADVGAARAAGVGAIVVGHGYSREAPDKLGADHVAAGLGDVARLLGLAGT